MLCFILILCAGCRSASKTAKINTIAEENKDVVVLAYLIQNYMRNTDNNRFTLDEILKYDTLGQIRSKFSKIEIGNWPNLWRGGYAVYFKFSDERKIDSVKLKPHERIPWNGKTKKNIGRDDIILTQNFNGEIHLYYQERFYHFAGMVLKQ